MLSDSWNHTGKVRASQHSYKQTMLYLGGMASPILKVFPDIISMFLIYCIKARFIQLK